MAFRTVDIMGNELTKFACTECAREYLPASEFSAPQLDKCAAQEEQNSREHTIRLLRAICKECLQQTKLAEAGKAKQRVAEAEAAAQETAWEQVTVNLAARPFGMVPLGAADADTLGYRVTKTTEGKPAWAEGVRAGWNLVAVNGEPVREVALSATQARLKEISLPVEVTFEKPPPEWQFCVGCSRPQPPQAFSRKMMTKPVDKRRCSACVQESQ